MVHCGAQIKVKAERNEILDPTRQIARYQAEIAHLRAKLSASPGTVLMDAHDPLHPEVRRLPIPTMLCIVIIHLTGFLSVSGGTRQGQGHSKVGPLTC
jgi:hypothetical protein